MTEDTEYQDDTLSPRNSFFKSEDSYMPSKKIYKPNQNSAVDLYSMSIQDQKPSLLRGSSSLAADTMTPNRNKSVISMPLYAKKI